MVDLIPDTLDFAKYLAETDNKQKVKPASDYLPAIKDRMRTMATERKVFFPWLKTRDSFYFRPGEMTIWAGQNGHGKSQLTAQIAMHLMSQGDRVCMASFEMKPVQTIRLMSRMFIGTNPFTPEYQSTEGFKLLDQIFDDFGKWSHKKLWIYDQLGVTSPEIVAGMTRYCARELGIQHVFIDSLMKVVGDEDDMNGQKRLVGELFSIAKDLNIHVHLVHHVRKPANEDAIPDKYDLKGSGAIVDQPDNIFTIFRNKKKERDAREAGQFGKFLSEPDCLLLCRKQRHFEGSGDGEPAIGLWLDRDSGCFVGNAGDAPFTYE